MPGSLVFDYFPMSILCLPWVVSSHQAELIEFEAVERYTQIVNSWVDLGTLWLDIKMSFTTQKMCVFKKLMHAKVCIM